MLTASISYVSRANPRDNSRHVILSTASMRPTDFAGQLNVSLANGWGIIRTVTDLCMKMPEGKYVLVKDPNKVCNIHTSLLSSRSPSASAHDPPLRRAHEHLHQRGRGGRRLRRAGGVGSASGAASCSSLFQVVLHDTSRTCSCWTCCTEPCCTLCTMRRQRGVVNHHIMIALLAGFLLRLRCSGYQR